MITHVSKCCVGDISSWHPTLNYKYVDTCGIGLLLTSLWSTNPALQAAASECVCVFVCVCVCTNIYDPLAICLIVHWVLGLCLCMHFAEHMHLSFCPCVHVCVLMCVCSCVCVYIFGWLLWFYCICVPVSLQVCGPVNSCGICSTTVMLCVVLEGPDNQMANTLLPTHTAILNTHTHRQTHCRD